MGDEAAGPQDWAEEFGLCPEGGEFPSTEGAREGSDGVGLEFWWRVGGPGWAG